MEKMMKISFIASAAFIAGLAVGFLIYYLISSSSRITGNVVSESESYAWTKAVCNSDNMCLDIEVQCENGNVVGIEPLEGMIYHEEGWVDPRGNSSLEFC